MAKGIVLLVMAAAASSVACLRVDAEGFRCGGERQCPPGFQCFGDDRCYRHPPDARPEVGSDGQPADARIDRGTGTGDPADACPPEICLLADGVACVVGRECVSGACVDGVCCESACGGPCQSCNQDGMAGTCAPLRNLVDPVCAFLSGVCDSEGACRRTNGRPCGSPMDCMSTFCVGSVCCDAECAGPCRACDQGSKAGTCAVIRNTDEPACLSRGGSCDNLGICKIRNGRACNGNQECVSGACADHVCCAYSCSGVCQTCNFSGTACQLVIGLPDPDTCSGGRICDNAGRCFAVADAGVSQSPRPEGGQQ